MADTGLIRQFNRLMAEYDERVDRADGWVTATDPGWRADWKARKDALVADVREHQRKVTMP